MYFNYICATDANSAWCLNIPLLLTFCSSSAHPLTTANRRRRRQRAAHFQRLFWNWWTTDWALELFGAIHSARPTNVESPLINYRLARSPHHYQPTHWPRSKPPAAAGPDWLIHHEPIAEETFVSMLLVLHCCCCCCCFCLMIIMLFCVVIG